MKNPQILWKNTFVTFQEIAGGFAIASVVALPLAWSMVQWKSCGAILQPLFVFSQCIPMFTLAPLMIYWFGWSFIAIIIPTALMVFFPLTMAIYQGLRSTPRPFIDYFRIHRATTWQTLIKLQLPWALPSLLTGMRISTAVAGIGAIAAEWAGAQQGLGVLMLESRRATDLALTFAALLCLTGLSLLFYGASLLLEQLLLKPYRRGYSHLAGLFLLALCSCGSQETGHKTVHLMLDWLPNPNHIPLYVGMQKGFFAAEGIDLQLTKITDPGDTVGLLMAEKIDLGIYYMPETYLANTQGAHLATVGLLVKEPLNAFIVRRDARILTPQDLSNKNLGYSVGGYGLFFLNNILAQQAVQLRALYNVNFDLVSTLGTGRVDAIYGAYWNIETEHLRSLGIETDYLPLSAFDHPHYYELIVVAKKGSCCATSEFTEKFKKALQSSIAFAKENPKQAFALYAQANPDKRGKTLAWEEAAWLKTLPLLADNQDDDPRIWQQFAEWVAKHR